MHWKFIVASLLKTGLSQSDIAARCGCRQNTISYLATGTTSDPRYSIGAALIALADGRGVKKPLRQNINNLENPMD